MKIILITAILSFLFVGCEQKPTKYPYGIPEEEFEQIVYGIINTNNSTSRSSGTVRFPTTGLEWKRCVQGQVFRSSTEDCKGNSTPTAFTPVDLTYGASFHAYCNTASNDCNGNPPSLIPILQNTNTSTSQNVTAYATCAADTTDLSPTDATVSAWRVPTIIELQALASLGKLSTFKSLPDAPDEKYWSASSEINDLTGETAKAVSFEPGTYGTEYRIKKDTKLYIRCVRNFSSR